MGNTSAQSQNLQDPVPSVHVCKFSVTKCPYLFALLFMTIYDLWQCCGLFAGAIVDEISHIMEGGSFAVLAK